MSAPSATKKDRRRRRADDAHDEAHPDERWLLTYADMITLLMALFIVMWSMSTVNTSKFHELAKSLSTAFGGGPLDGGTSVLRQGSEVLNPAGMQVENVRPPEPAHITPITKQLEARFEKMGRARESESLLKLKRQLEAYAKTHGLQGKIASTIDERGLVIRLLTDDVLFATGEANLQRRALPVLGQISNLIASERITNQIRVEGNTDSIPIATPAFPSNWELSTARATAVLRHLAGGGVDESRLSAAGYADQRPVAPNSSPAGRARNRRVEIVVLRRFGRATEGVTP